MSLDTTGTILTMSIVSGGDILPFYSARGIIQTMKPIGASNSQRETVNFERVDLSLSKSRKYASRVSARTIRPPAIDNVFPGTKLLVGCAYLLSYATVGGTPSRTAVSGSTFTENGWTFYRPQITFMVTDLSEGFAEWEADNDWFIDMTEVLKGA